MKLSASTNFNNSNVGNNNIFSSSAPATSGYLSSGFSSTRPFIVMVAGGTASGKTTVCENIMKELQKDNSSRRVALISQDSFYRSLTPDQRADVAHYNFDHPGNF